MIIDSKIDIGVQERNIYYINGRKISLVKYKLGRVATLYMENPGMDTIDKIKHLTKFEYLMKKKLYEEANERK